jgi:GNAT superfamily N-acetyltransferase
LNGLSGGSFFRILLHPISAIDLVVWSRLKPACAFLRYPTITVGAFCSEGLIGVANLANDAMGRAEIAVLVRSDWKRRGIGETLMRAALCHAKQERLPVYAFIQPSNSAIIALMRRLGFVYGLGQVDNPIMHWRPAEMQRSGDVGAGAGRQEQGRPRACFGELILPTATI